MKALKSKIRNLFYTLKLYFHHSLCISFSRKVDNGRIVICFDGVIPHGGLVDRIKGIISFYEVAKSLNYDFFIYFENPFNLSFFLKPNKFNWILKKNGIKFNPFKTKILHFVDKFDVNPLEIIKNSNHKDFIVYSNVDYLKKIHSQIDENEYNLVWKQNYNDLFKKSDILINALDKLPNEKRIVIHSRFTSLLGDFVDSTKTILSHQEQNKLIQDLLQKINEIQQSKHSKSIYVLSDSVFFLNEVSKHSNLKILDGVPKHVDVKTNQLELDSHLKTFTDFYFMIESDEIYLLKLGKMYNSGFSRYAAKIGNIKFTIVE